MRNAASLDLSIFIQSLKAVHMSCRTYPARLTAAATRDTLTRCSIGNKAEPFDSPARAMVTFGAQGIVSVLGWLVRLSAHLHAPVCDGAGGLCCRCSFLVPAFFWYVPCVICCTPVCVLTRSHGAALSCKQPPTGEPDGHSLFFCCGGITVALSTGQRC